MKTFQEYIDEDIVLSPQKPITSFLENNFIARIKKNTLVIFCGTKNFNKGTYQYKKTSSIRLGHFGRFVNQKNHIRLIKIFNVYDHRGRGVVLFTWCSAMDLRSQHCIQSKYSTFGYLGVDKI